MPAGSGTACGGGWAKDLQQGGGRARGGGGQQICLQMGTRSPGTARGGLQQVLVPPESLGPQHSPARAHGTSASSAQGLQLDQPLSDHASQPAPQALWKARRGPPKAAAVSSPAPTPCTGRAAARSLGRGGSWAPHSDVPMPGHRSQSAQRRLGAAGPFKSRVARGSLPSLGHAPSTPISSPSVRWRLPGASASTRSMGAEREARPPRHSPAQPTSHPGNPAPPPVQCHRLRRYPLLPSGLDILVFVKLKNVRKQYTEAPKKAKRKQGD